MTYRGARYIHVYVPCPLGWGCASHATISLARLVVETGFFPLFEADHGKIINTKPIRQRIPIEEYLKPQRRFAHLFKTESGQEAIRKLQAMADHNIAEYNLLRAEEEVI